LADKKISSLIKVVLAIWGGDIDINKNGTNMELKCSRNFALKCKHKPVLAMTAPHRQELHESSCINKKIQLFNWKLRKMKETIAHAVIAETN
jgi:hypothetical protein